jgi:ERCC4-type nuclease
MIYFAVIVACLAAAAAGRILWEVRLERETFRTNFMQMNIQWQLHVRQVENMAMTVAGIEEMVLRLAQKITEPPAVPTQTWDLVKDTHADYERAFNTAEAFGAVSASMLRAHLGIGYGKARRLVEKLIFNKVVSAKQDRRGQRPLLDRVNQGHA